MLTSTTLDANAAPSRPRLRFPRALEMSVLLLLVAPACKRGSPPVMFDVGDQVAVVGEQLVLQLVASDPDGDALTYEFAAASVPDLGNTAAITRTPGGQGVFTFTPLASQIGMQVFDFSAFDGRHRDTISAVIDVRGAVGSGSMPIFRSPLGSGSVLDLDQTDCVSLELLVEDPDSASITLTEHPPLIEGALLTTADNGLTGSWGWCPNPRQVEQDDRYYLTLSADDGDNPPVLKDYVIVLRRRAGEDCPGEAPIIEHTPADFSTRLDLPITVDIEDDQGLGSLPYVAYATEDPGDPIDFTKLTLADMELQSGDMVNGTWRAMIPNFLANEAEGTQGPLYYLISATDDDDMQGTCDHRSDNPASGVHRVTVTLSGDDAAGLCDPCSFDVQCGDADDLCLPAGSGAGVCGRSCSDDAECGDGFVCLPEPVESVEGSLGRQCIPNTGSCSGDGGNCQDDDSEPNGSPDQALAQAALPPGTLGSRVLCSDDDDWYRIELDAQAQVSATLSGEVPPDLDIALTTMEGVLLESSDGLTSDESFTSGCLDAGTYLLRVHSIDAEPDGSYTLGWELDADTCSSTMGEGDCCENNGSPGCDDAAIQACACGIDSFCCDTTWDGICVGIASNDCDAPCDGGSTGGSMNEDCCTAQDTPGCTDPAIEACVCALDPFCCDNTWDPMCVGRVGNDLCGPSCMPDDADGQCCTNNGTPGCEVNSVESCVCAEDSFCCDIAWDDMCVDAIPVHGCGTCPA